MRERVTAHGPSFHASVCRSKFSVSCRTGRIMGKRNMRYYAVGGWKARNAAIEACRARAANGEPCAICGQPIDVTLTLFIDTDGKRKRHPLSCECDEIVPISRGGLPYGDNTRPVHRVCNERRGAAMSGDMRPSNASCKAIRPTTHDAASSVTAGRW